MKIGFTAEGWADYLYWQEADGAIVRRLNILIKEVASPSLYEAPAEGGGLGASMGNIV